MGGGLSVTQTAMELGYGSISAFVYAFRSDMGISPQAYIRGGVANRGRAQPASNDRRQDAASQEEANP
jgi:AraC-like DNA-binding protein